MAAEILPPAPPAHLHRRFSGTRVDEGTMEENEIHWVLSLSSFSEPQAFGSESYIGGLAIVAGTWEHTANVVQLETRPTNELQFEFGRAYHGRIYFEQDLWVIKGTWKEKDGTKQGLFACSADGEGGLWLGKLPPDPSLEPFALPTNPLRWSLAFIPLDDGSAAIEGGGCFNDSGDVLGRPILYFTISGSMDVAGAIVLRKSYESLPSNETSGYAVDYTARRSEDRAGNLWLKGEWKNEHPEGGYGTFWCHREPNFSNETMQIVLCGVCGMGIQPGDMRWNCPRCRVEGGYAECDTCKNRGDGQCKQPMARAVNVGAASSGGQRHDAEVRCSGMLVPESVFETRRIDESSCAALVHRACVEFGRRPFLGTRSSNNGVPFSYVTYARTLEMCKGLAAHLLLLLPSDATPRSIDGCKVLLVGATSVEYVVAMLTTILLGGVLVPVSGQIDDDALAFIVDKVKPSLAFVDTSHKARVESAFNRQQQELRSSTPAKMVALSTLRRVADEGTARLSSLSPCPETVAAGGGRGGDVVDEAMRAVARGETRQRRLSAILFTSGSTGRPKGAAFTDDLLRPDGPVTTLHPFVRLDFEPFDPTLCLSLLQTVRCGGQRAISSSLATLMDDFRACRPTHVAATPALWNSLYQDYTSRVMQEVRTLPPAEADAGGATLAHAERKEAAERRVAASMQDVLGNRCRVGSVGGAPVSDAVFQFVRNVLKIDIANTYGTRECGGIAMNGVVYPGIDIKLLDVPEMNYFRSDIPSRGEICVHSPRAIPGYFADSAATSKNFVKLGGSGSDEKVYFRTGDIAEMWVGDDGKTRLKIIDRRSFVLKLAQGEFVAPSKVEAILENHPFVEQALVVGRPDANAVVAVVVPSLSSLSAAGMPPPTTTTLKAANGNSDAESSSAEEEPNPAFVRQLACELTFSCRHHHLRTFEVPARIVVDMQGPWTAENELLTSNMKKNRRRLHARYAAHTAPLLDQLSVGVAPAASTDQGSALAADAAPPLPFPPPPPPPESVPAALREVLERVMPLSSSDSLDGGTTLADLGADSLVAGRLTGLLKERGVSLSVGSLFEYSLSHLGDLVDRASKGTLVPADEVEVNQSLAIDFTSEYKVRVDGSGGIPLASWARETTSEPLPVRSFSGERAAPRPQAEAQTGGSIFMTGATGFLGPLLVLSLLKSFPAKTIYCLVRGSDDATAEKRLLRELRGPHQVCRAAGRIGRDTGDDGAAAAAAAAAEGLAVINEAMMTGRVVCVRGDLKLPGFGVFNFGDPCTAAHSALLQAKLLETCDLVMHNASWVNHHLPYSVLRGANVGGTRSAIDLALRCTRRPRFHLVSSVSALPVGVKSTEEIVPLSPSQMSQRDGYGQTKVVAEQLLSDAASRFNLPVSIYRPSVICGSSKTGYSNVADFENHLIRAMILCGGVVKQTSYAFGWVPVDFVAESIAAIAAAQEDKSSGTGGMTGGGTSGGSAGVDTFHLNGIGPTMECVVSCLESLGYSLRDMKAGSIEWASAIEALSQDELLDPYRDMLKCLNFPSAGLLNVSHTHDRARQVLETIHGAEAFAEISADSWPQVSSKTVMRCLSFLKKSGATDEPSGRGFLPAPRRESMYEL